MLLISVATTPGGGDTVDEVCAGVVLPHGVPTRVISLGVVRTDDPLVLAEAGALADGTDLRRGQQFRSTSWPHLTALEP